MATGTSTKEYGQKLHECVIEKPELGGKNYALRNLNEGLRKSTINISVDGGKAEKIIKVFGAYL